MTRAATLSLDDVRAGSALDAVPGSLSWLELPRMLRDPARFLRQRHAAHGALFKTRFVTPIVFAVGEHANHTLHVSSSGAFGLRRAYQRIAFGRVFGGSVVVQEGDELRSSRARLQTDLAGLHSDPSLVQQIWDRALDRIADGEVRDVHAFVRDVVFDVTVRALLGLELGDQLGEYRRQLELLVHGATAALPLRLPGGRLDRALRIRDALIARLAPQLDAPSGCPMHGLMRGLARRSDGGTATQEAVEQLLLMFWAGYDSSASFHSWILHELARAPAWQEKLHADEQQAGFVLKEIERLRPPALFLPRTTEEDVELCGVWLPRGTSVFYSPYLSHREAKHFPRPDEFDPGRWDPATSARVPPISTLVGFGGGQRVCIGRAFALMHARVAMMAVVRRFRLEAAQPSFGVQQLPIYRPCGSRIRFRLRAHRG